jgi:HEAT repeat protein
MAQARQTGSGLYHGSVAELLLPASVLGPGWQRSVDLVVENVSGGVAEPAMEGAPAFAEKMEEALLIGLTRQGVRAAANAQYLAAPGGAIRACDVRILLFADTERAAAVWQEKLQSAEGFSEVRRLGDAAVVSSSAGQIRFRRANVGFTLTPVGDPKVCQDLAPHLDAEVIRRTGGAPEVAVKPVFPPVGRPSRAEKQAEAEKECLEFLEEASRHPPPAVVPSLLAQLKHESVRCRAGATKVLAAIGNADALGGLILALDDRSWEVNLEAIRGLGATGDPATIKPLLEVLRWQRNNAQLEAGKALAALNQPAVVPALLTVLEKPRIDHWERAGVLRALAQVGYPDGYRALLQRYKSNPSLSEVDFTTLDAIASIGVPVIEPLFAECRRGAKRICDALAQVISEIGTPAVDLLIDALEDQDSHIRSAAADALGEIRDERAILPLIESLGDPARDVRRYAASALGRIGNPEAVSALVELLSDQDSGVGGSAQSALESIGPPGLDAVRAAVSHSDARARERALSLLDRFHDTKTIPLAQSCLSDPDAAVRTRAAGLLKHRQAEGALPDLARAMEAEAIAGDAETLERHEACLRSFREKSTAVVLPLTSHSDHRVRAAAIRALSDPEAKAVKEALVAAGNDPVEEVRLASKFTRNRNREHRQFVEDFKGGRGKSRQEAARHLRRAFSSMIDSRTGTQFIFWPIHDDGLVDVLFAGLQDPEVRWVGAFLLSGISRKDERIRTRLLEQLEQLLKKDDIKLRHDVVQALTRMDRASATNLMVDRLVQLSREKPTGEQASLAKALAGQGSEAGRDAALRWAISALGSERTSEAAKILGRLRDPRGVEPLLRELENRERNWNPNTLIRALGEIGDRRAVEPLARIAIREYDGRGRQRAARRALHKLVGKTFASPEHWQAWWEQDKAKYLWR